MTKFVQRSRRDGATIWIPALLIAFVSVAVAAAATPKKTASAPRGAATKATVGIVSISIHPSSVTTQSEVAIGDVASVEGGEAKLRSRIAGLDLADAPALGRSTRLTRDLITHRLRIAGIDARQYKLSGAEEVVLSSRGYRVPENEIVAAAKQFLLTRLPWKADDITIASSRPLRTAVDVPGGKEDVRFEASLNAARISLGNVRVDVTIFSKDVKQAEVPVSLEVHLCQTVAVASRRIDRGQMLASEDIYYERRPVDAIAGFLTEAESPVGQRTKRTILPLQIVTKADVDSAEPDTAVVVRQRDAVKLVARAGNLVVTASGEALQDGRSGQMIRVRNVDSKSVVTGRVVSRNEVQVLY